MADTPIPEYVPPLGVDPVNVVGAQFIHCVGNVFIDTTGKGFTVTRTEAEVAEHELFSTVTEYVPAVEILIDCVEALFDHVLPEEAEEVNVTAPP